MSMGYIVYREDLADEAEVQFALDNNPDMYPMGTAIQSKDGNAWIVTFNDGVTITIGKLNSGEDIYWTADGDDIYNNNTLVEAMRIHSDGGITIGDPTGGSLGAGTLNVENGVFVNGETLATAYWEA